MQQIKDTAIGLSFGLQKDLFEEEETIRQLRKQEYERHIPVLTQHQAGVHYDEGKSRVDLLDPEWLEDVGRVLGYGATKYSANNYRNGIAVSRIIASLLRHTFSLMRGEDTDKESGLSHVSHISCNAMFLHWMLTNRKDLDDRYLKGNK